MRIPDPILAVGNRMLETGHRTLRWITGSRFPHTVFGMKPVELYTTGRKSGRIYSTMLCTPVHDERRVVLVASKGGYQDHPDWYKNLVVNPVCPCRRSCSGTLSWLAVAGKQLRESQGVTDFLESFQPG